MKRLLASVLAGSLAVAGLTVYAADPVKSAGDATAKEAGRSDDPASAEKKMKAKKSVKAQGGPCTPGAGDSSAAAKTKAQGGDVKCLPDASAAEPGRAGDAASAEKKH